MQARRSAGGRVVGGQPGPADGRVRELIGQAIRIRREKAGMTLEQAAEKLGIDPKTLKRWEGGTGSLWTGGDAGTVDHAMMDRLKEAYGAQAHELYPRNQYPSAPVDPAHRRDWVRRRNAAIAGIPEDEYLQAIAEQDARRAHRDLEQR